MEKVKELANMRKKVERHNLKFKHSNWNTKFDRNIYYNFEVKFGVFPKIIFRHTIYHFEVEKSKVQHFKQCANWN